MAYSADARLFADASLQKKFAVNKPFFVSPPAAGRRITAGFSYIQRITKAGAVDVWFPDELRENLDARLAAGHALTPKDFPAEWAAVRQFELLQEAGNYKIYDLDGLFLTRTLMDLSKSMRGGGYRVTVATVGSYDNDERDDLEILDKRLQDRIANLTHMMYLDEPSEAINAATETTLAAERWDYRTALPHIGVMLGAEDLFKPRHLLARTEVESFVVPPAPHRVTAVHAADWSQDCSVKYGVNGVSCVRVKARPQRGQYAVAQGIYEFAPADCGQEVIIEYARSTAATETARRHQRARQMFDVLSLLPQKHIVHDTAIGLQLPENIAENEWIYVADRDAQLSVFNVLLNDLFAPFGKNSSQQLRGYGDRLRPDFDQFYRDLGRFAM